MSKRSEGAKKLPASPEPKTHLKLGKADYDYRNNHHVVNWFQGRGIQRKVTSRAPPPVSLPPWLGSRSPALPSDRAAGRPLQPVGTIGASLASGTSATDGLIAYLSYFTIQTNGLVAVLMTLALLLPESRSPLLRASVMSGAAVYIAIVGLLYRWYLYGFLHPRGHMVLADVLLHVAVPLLFLMFWLLFVPKGTLNWTHPFV